MSKKQSVLHQDVKVINMGIKRFSEDLKEAGVPVIHMDWRPPAGGNWRLIKMLDRITEESGFDRDE